MIETFDGIIIAFSLFREMKCFTTSNPSQSYLRSSNRISDSVASYLLQVICQRVKKLNSLTQKILHGQREISGEPIPTLLEIPKKTRI